MLKEVLAAVILILAIPIGLLIAKLCEDELRAGRKWFLLLAIISTISAVLFIFLDKIIAFSLLFLIIISLISFWKSYI